MFHPFAPPNAFQEAVANFIDQYNISLPVLQDNESRFSNWTLSLYSVSLRHFLSLVERNLACCLAQIGLATSFGKGMQLDKGSPYAENGQLSLLLASRLLMKGRGKMWAKDEKCLPQDIY